GTPSSRLPSRMSTVGAMSGTFATILGFDGGKKWIIREGRTGISRTGSGAPTARGRKKSFGLRIAGRAYEAPERAAKVAGPRGRRVRPAGGSGGAQPGREPLDGAVEVGRHLRRQGRAEPVQLGGQGLGGGDHAGRPPG